MTGLITAQRLTVFMPAFNAEKYIGEAIGSILNQSYEDFELLIIDDGSTDGTVTIIESFNDGRIRLLLNGDNKGLTYTRNKGLREAKGELLAILDADDWAYPNRLELQMSFMSANPEIALCGGQAILMDENGKDMGHYQVPQGSAYVRENMLFRNIFINPSCMFRVSKIKDLGGYRDFAPAEDFDLSIRIAEHYTMFNFGEVLIKYRMHNGNASVRSEKVVAQEKKLLKSMQEKIGLSFNNKLIEIHHAVFLYQFDVFSAEEFRSFFIELNRSNRQTNYLNQDFLEEMCFDRWFEILKNKRPKSNALSLYLTTGIFKLRMLKLKDALRMFRWSIKGVFFSSLQTLFGLKNHK